MIEERPEIVKGRKEVAHWEADTMVSRQSKAAVQVIVERSTRYTAISKLPAKSARHMMEKLIERLGSIHGIVHKTITFDNRTENAEHEIVAKELGVETYFCHPYQA